VDCKLQQILTTIISHKTCDQDLHLYGVSLTVCSLSAQKTKKWWCIDAIYYTNCAVKAHKVQTVQLTLYKIYKCWRRHLRKIKLDYTRWSSVMLGFYEVQDLSQL